MVLILPPYFQSSFAFTILNDNALFRYLKYLIFNDNFQFILASQCNVIEIDETSSESKILVFVSF